MTDLIVKPMTTDTTRTPVEEEGVAPSVPSRRRYTVILIVAGILVNIVFVAYSGNYALATKIDPFILWRILAIPIGCAAPFILIKREKNPYGVSIALSVLTVIFLLSSFMAAFGVAGVVARSDEKDKVKAITAGGLVASFISVASDLSVPERYSFWMLVWSGGTPANTDDMVLHLTLGKIVAAAAIALAFTLSAYACGVLMRNKAVVRSSVAKAQSEKKRADSIQMSLSNKQIVDSIAAEAHDTLAHSLSLIAVNAATLKTDIDHLVQNPTDEETRKSLQQRSSDIRAQAAGSLDEAHSIINMLRHPEEAARLLAPAEETALTQEALDALFAEVRESGTELRLWIDIRGLSGLNPNVGKLAFRVIQEGLTNARRHAFGTPVSLSVTLAPTTGIVISMSNPMPATRAPSSRHPSGGNGLPGLKKRVEEAGGVCLYGVDENGIFRLDVKMAFVSIS